MPDLGALFSQIQSLMQPHDGPVNWDFATRPGPQGRSPSRPTRRPRQQQQDAVADAVRLADHWLDEATEFPSGVTSTAAWSRAEWIVGTTDVWKVLVEPVAERSVNSIAAASAARGGRGRWPGRCSACSASAVGAMLATQVGSGPRRAGRRGADRLRHRAAARRPPARPRWCRPTSPRSPRASTSPRTTYSSTSRCARPPTSGCSPTCRGCATT